MGLARFERPCQTGPEFPSRSSTVTVATALTICRIGVGVTCAMLAVEFAGFYRLQDRIQPGAFALLDSS